MNISATMHTHKSKWPRTRQVVASGALVITIAAAAAIASIGGSSGSHSPITNTARPAVVKPYVYASWQPATLSYLVASEDEAQHIGLAIAQAAGEAELPGPLASVAVVPDGAEHDLLVGLARATAVQSGTGGQAGVRILDMRKPVHSIPDQRSVFYLENSAERAATKEAAASGERTMLYEAGLPDPFRGGGYFVANSSAEEAAAFDAIALEVGRLLESGAVDLVVVDERLPLILG